MRIEDRTPDVATFLKELSAAKPAKRIYGKIKKIDLYRLPLWLKIAVPTALAAVAAFVALVLTGVIDLKVNQDPFIIPEGVVMVPDVEELPASQAITIIEESGLLAKTGGNVETPYVSAGTIVLQTPGTGTFMDKNGTVVLIVSSGGEIISPVAGKATVPYMIWDSVEAAKKKMAEAGLGEPEIEEAYDDNVAEGQIISQSLETGTEVEEGTVLKIVVSKGPAPFAMEEYSAKTEADAKEALEALGVKVLVEYESNNDVAEGTVLRQTPAAGEEVRRGDSVTLIVSSGKETIQLPDVKGKAQAEAEKELKDLGFTVNVLENYDESIAKGLVVSQTPEAGTSQLYGSAVTLYVSKGKQNLVLHFDAAGGSAVDDVTVKRGETYGTLPESRRDGYIFEGWYTEAEGGSAVKADTKVSAEDDHTVYAHWSKVPETQAPTQAPTQPPATQPVVFSVSFDSNGGSACSSVSVTSGNAIGTLPSTSRTGYTFAGWFTDKNGGSQVNANTKVTGNMTVYAHWNINSYTVTFDGNGGTAGKGSVTVTYYSSVGTLPGASRTGYTFAGWFTGKTGGSQISADTKVTGNMTVYAHWSTNSYTVTFDGNGGTPDKGSASVTYNTAIGTLPGASRTGYTFAGWFTGKTDGNQITANSIITGNMTVYAHWSTNNYTVTFDGNGGTPDKGSASVAYNSAIGSLPGANRTGYTFAGWFTGKTDGNQISTDTKVTGNMTVYAHWSVNSYTVTFDGNGGTSDKASVSVNYNSTIGSLPGANRTGYTFAGWFTGKTDGNQISTDTKVTGNITVYAHWSVNSYTVSLTETEEHLVKVLFQ